MLASRQCWCGVEPCHCSMGPHLISDKCETLRKQSVRESGRKAPTDFHILCLFLSLPPVKLLSLWFSCWLWCLRPVSSAGSFKAWRLFTSAGRVVIKWVTQQQLDLVFILIAWFFSVGASCTKRMFLWSIILVSAAFQRRMTTTCTFGPGFYPGSC